MSNRLRCIITANPTDIKIAAGECCKQQCNMCLSMDLFKTQLLNKVYRN